MPWRHASGSIAQTAEWPYTSYSVEGSAIVGALTGHTMMNQRAPIINGSTWENAMAFIPIPNTIKAVVEYLLDGQEVANIFHIDTGAAVTSVVINAVLDEIVDWLTAELMPLLSQDLDVTAVTGRDMSSSTGMLIERPIDPVISGGAAYPALPNNVALCMTWFTNLAGRSYRGRTYITGLGENMCIGSHIDTTDATLFATAGAELVNLIAGIGYDLVVASLQTANAPRATGVTTEITAAGVNTVTDSQRRRLPGRGN